MLDMKGMANVQLVIAFIVPGLIITYVRTRFVTGRMEKPGDAALSYLSLTIVYYGLALPVLELMANRPPGLVTNLCWWALIAIGPASFGVLLGVGTQRGWIRHVAHRLGMRPVHSTPNAWDWRFSACHNSCFVMVTLSNGDTVAGVYGPGSFASSDPADRDIYLEEIWDVGDYGSVWTSRPEKQGILLPAKEIRHVQFWS